MAAVNITDSTGNPIESDNLTNGRGLRVVNLADAAVKGRVAMGADLSSERPVFIGVWASTSIANPAPATEGQLIALKAAADGRLITVPFTGPEDVIQTPPVLMANDTSLHELVPAISGFKLALVGLIVSTTGTLVHCAITDGAAVGMVRIPLVNEPNPFPVPFKTSAVSLAIDYQLSAPPGANTAWVTPLVYKTKL